MRSIVYDTYMHDSNTWWMHYTDARADYIRHSDTLRGVECS